MAELTITLTDPAEERKQRLAALLLTIPHWTQNYTETVERAEWLIREAGRVGWVLSIVANEEHR